MSWGGSIGARPCEGAGWWSAAAEGVGVGRYRLGGGLRLGEHALGVLLGVGAAFGPAGIRAGVPGFGHEHRRELLVPGLRRTACVPYASGRAVRRR
ncbi:hypothetical protein ACU686_31640 [Yinghuangia aomiensis]